jgi:Ca-activated chloride channel homolog
MKRLLLLACLLLIAPAHGAEAPVAVAILNPTPSAPSFGEFEVAAEVYAEEPIRQVEFYVDGKLVGTDYKRPYRVKIDVGYENLEHRYRVVAYGASGAVGEETVVTPPISVDMELNLDLQQLYVTVDRGSQRALDLARGDFEVLDDGQQQDLVTFERGDVPLTAVVLLDTSQSMAGVRLQKALDGARKFIDGLQGLDQGMVILFSDHLLRSTPFSSDRAVLDDALAGVSAAGGTALNDHLYLALKRLEAQPGRPVIVLLSDGTDAHSALPMQEVLWKIRRSQALLYWILLEGEGKSSGDTISTAWRDGKANKEELELLRKGVEQSGGEIYPIARPEELAGAFQSILAELREQYVLGYYPSNSRHDGAWHRVKVEVKPLGLRVRHRGGYVDG